MSNNDYQPNQRNKEQGHGAGLGQGQGKTPGVNQSGNKNTANPNQKGGWQQGGNKDKDHFGGNK